MYFYFNGFCFVLSTQKPTFYKTFTKYNNFCFKFIDFIKYVSTSKSHLILIKRNLKMSKKPEGDIFAMIEHTEEMLFTLRNKLLQVNSFFLEPSTKEKLIEEIKLLKFNIKQKSFFIDSMMGYKL